MTFKTSLKQHFLELRPIITRAIAGNQVEFRRTRRKNMPKPWPNFFAHCVTSPQQIRPL
jgi:hypothetical protein